MAPLPPPSSRPDGLSALLLSLLLLLLLGGGGAPCAGFYIPEATVDDIQLAFDRGELTSAKLEKYHADQIRALNPVLRAVIEVNPESPAQAGRADRQRLRGVRRGRLQGITVLLKDNLATADALNTTAGSLALLGAVAPRDAGVVRRLRAAGAVVLGKASMSEWAAFRSFSAPSGWSARGGQGKNPYVLSVDPCGSSSGSAIAVAANLVSVSLGTETDGSILCPSAANGVVGIKPTVGLTSRAGVIPLSPRQDTIGPITRTVSDAVHLLDVIVGYDPRDAEATREASKFIPYGGYRRFLRADGAKGRRLGILRKPFFDFPAGSNAAIAFESHFDMLRRMGAVVIDNLEIANISLILDPLTSGEQIAMVAEFKLSLNQYLSELSYSPVRSLADVIDFNNKHGIEERMRDFGQPIFLLSQNTSGIGPDEQMAIARMSSLSRDGLERVMKERKLDAVITPDSTLSSVLAIGGYPGITVPAGYHNNGAPFGICFGGLRGSEPTLIGIAYAFEQATKIRKPPRFKQARRMSF